jgi:hypothetical protein
LGFWPIFWLVYLPGILARAYIYNLSKKECKNIGHTIHLSAPAVAIRGSVTVPPHPKPISPTAMPPIHRCFMVIAPREWFNRNRGDYSADIT